MSKGNKPDSIQHLLMCGTEACGNHCQFYCNNCHQLMCEQCRDDHQKSPETKKHELFLYRERKHHIHVERGKLHPTRQINLLCKDCSAPLCSKYTSMKEHSGHKFDDLEDKLAEKLHVASQKYSISEHIFSQPPNV